MRTLSRLGVLAFVVFWAALTPAVAQVPARGQAVGVNGPYMPPTCVPGVPFADITCTTGFDPWIEQFGLDGITAGCGGGLFCPSTPVTRDQMAVFIEKALRGTANWPPHTQLVWAVKAADGSPDALASGQALLNAMAAIPISGNDAPSASNPWLVRIGPGRFDVQNYPVHMAAYVDIVGAGENATVIIGVGHLHDVTGTIIAASAAELRDLSVENTGGDYYAVGIFNPSGSSGLTLTGVSVTATGGSILSYGLYNLGSNSRVLVRNCTFYAAPSGALNSDAAAIYNGNASVIEVNGSNLTVSIPVIGSVATLIKNYNTNLVLRGSVLTTDPGSVIPAAGGVRNDGSIAMIEVIERSTIENVQQSIQDYAPYVVYVGASQLDGPVDFSGTGFFRCAGSYSTAFLPLSGGCT